MQELSDDSVMKWYTWAGGVARQCLRENKAGGDVGLQQWINEVDTVITADRSTAELLVRSLHAVSSKFAHTYITMVQQHSGCCVGT